MSERFLVGNIRGPQGDKGDKPAHSWSGTSLSFQNPDGTQGQYVDLKGDTSAAEGLAQQAANSAAEAASIATQVIATGGVPEAPSDGKQYVRQSAVWSEVNAVSKNGDTMTGQLTVPRPLVIHSDGGEGPVAHRALQSYSISQPAMYLNVGRDPSVNNCAEFYFRNYGDGNADNYAGVGLYGTTNELKVGIDKTESTKPIYENGQRVYSPNNPPPVGAFDVLTSYSSSFRFVDGGRRSGIITGEHCPSFGGGPLLIWAVIVDGYGVQLWTKDSTGFGGSASFSGTDIIAAGSGTQLDYSWKFYRF